MWLTLYTPTNRDASSNCHVPSIQYCTQAASRPDDRRGTDHVVAQGDDDELRVLRSFFDVAGHDRHLVLSATRQDSIKTRSYISEVQRGVDLVHDV